MRQYMTMNCGRIVAICFGILLAATSFAQFGNAPSVSFRTFKRGDFSNITKQSLLVLDDRDQFEQYWQNSTGNPGDTAPAGVDWQKEKLIAVHLGQRPTGGYKFFVRSIRRIKIDIATISAIEQLPMPGSFVTQSLTSPYVILRIPRTISSRFALSVEEGEAMPGVTIIQGGNVSNGTTCSCCSGGNCTCPNCNGSNNNNAGNGQDGGNR